MKQSYKLTHEELTAILAAVEQSANAQSIWEGVCGRLGIKMEGIEDARTGDPHEFLAEPLAKAPTIAPDEKVRGEWTSASNAQADSLCPGRHIAQTGIPDSESEDAAMGKRIHAALCGADPFAAKNLALEDREIFDACRDIEKKLCDQFFGETLPAPMRVFREERRWVRFTPALKADLRERLEHPEKPLGHSGQADAVFRSGTKALVIDYKVLRGDVEDSPANMQLRDLAVLTWRNIELLSEIGTAIVQPLVTHSPEICLYTAEDLARAETEMFERVIKSNDPASPRVPGVAQCKWCKAKDRCPEYGRWIGNQLPIVAESAAIQSGLFDKPLVQWTPDDRALFAAIKPVLAKRIDEVWDYLKDGQAQDAGFVPGFMLKPGSIRKPITNPQALFERFAAEGGKLEDFLPCVEVNKGEFRKALNEVTGAKGMKLDKALDVMTDGITESKQSAPTLVKEGAK